MAGPSAASGSAEGIQWQVVPLEGLDSQELAPFRVMAVAAISEFAIVERAICARLQPPGRTAVDPSHVTAEDPIDARFRPPRCDDSLVHGGVVLLPFDALLAGEHDHGLQRRIAIGGVDNQTPGFTAVFFGVVKSLGYRFLDTTYHLSGSSIRRTVGISRSQGDIDAENAARNSSLNALRLASVALRHAYAVE